MAELLIEILSEEIPAPVQGPAAQALEAGMLKGLGEAGLTWTEVETFVTPRRLGIVIDGLPITQEDRIEERRGPRTNAPDKAVEGFLGSTGVTRADLVEREAKNGTFYFAIVKTKGRPTSEVVAETLVDVITNFPWPKSMHWGSGRLTWVRPMQNLCCVFDGAAIPVNVMDEMTANAVTFGHRFMAPARIKVRNYKGYKKSLEAAQVQIFPEDREQSIREQADQLAKASGYEVIADDALFREVAGLVECPNVLIGRFDEAFLSMPEEVLITAMRAHQRYFGLRGQNGALAPAFIFVADYKASDGDQTIIAGNERVLTARLADAEFFWEQDQKETLESHARRLAGVIFQADLGNLEEKVSRMSALSTKILGAVQDHPLQPASFLDADGAAGPAVVRAAELCKADLVTSMVGEFPDLQGLMGRFYAEQGGEPAAVSAAIEEHYAPKGPSDACPTGLVSMVTALSDKIDTLAGFFMIAEPPTGSRDPYALRRAALGVVRILLESKMRLGLRPILTCALDQYAEQGFSGAADNAVEDLMAFIGTRLSVHLRDSGVPHDYINAVFALEGEDDLVRVIDRVDALVKFLKTADGENLLRAHKRATNIVAIEEERDNRTFDGTPDEKALTLPEETDLFNRLQAVAKSSKAAIGQEAFGDVMAALASLRAPVDAFFDKVTVNADDQALRENRLKILAQIRETLGLVADFSEIEGP